MHDAPPAVHVHGGVAPVEGVHVFNHYLKRLDVVNFGVREVDFSGGVFEKGGGGEEGAEVG